jgi:hypothetical protein
MTGCHFGDTVTSQAAGHGWTLLFPDRQSCAGGPVHCAAYLENTDGFTSKVSPPCCAIGKSLKSAGAKGTGALACAGGS